MTRARLLLAAIMILLVVSLSFVLKSNADDFVKIVSEIAAAILFTSSLILMCITFFTLDKEGRIPHDSLTWRYFGHFYETWETKDGKHQKVVKMPERIKLCPAYWMIAGGLFIAAIIIGLGVLIFYGLTNLFVYGPPNSEDFKKGTMILGILFSIVGLLFGITYGLYKLERKIFLKIWLSSLTAGVVSLIFSLAFKVNMEKGVSLTNAIFLTAWEFGVGVATIIAAAITIIAVVVGIVMSLIKIAPWIKNSIVGRIVAAIFNGLCPILTLAPAPALAPVAIQTTENPSS